MVDHTLPAQATPFIGRDEELASIAGMLSKPACRLLTLAGPGGIGKTRLALEAAARRQTSFAHGAHFVSLQAVTSVDHLTSAVADALDLSLSGSRPPAQQLTNALRDRELLLLLDNLEQLLVGEEEMQERTAQWLSDVLRLAPAAQLLVTSQVALNLQEEWIYRVGGLRVPAIGEDEGLEKADAVQLFVERARRVQPDFSLADDHSAVADICRLVDGMPLALELAASWTKILDCQTITKEIRRNIDFLETSLRNVPDRHRSIQAVFDQSWKLLGQQERSVFKQLSVFRGGFTRPAAEEVAGATLPILSALADKSLLRRDSQGRYQIHDLLRKYAEEKLQQSPEDVRRARDRHCATYMELLRQRTKDLQGRAQLEAVARIEADVENVRVAWKWAVEQKKVEAIGQAILTFTHFADFRGRYVEQVDALEHAARNLEEVPPGRRRNQVLATVLTLLGWAHIRLGRHGEARSALERSRTLLYDELDAHPPPGMGTDPLTGLGTLALISGDYERAAELGRQALQFGEKRDDAHNRQIAFYVLASATLAQGRYEQARHYAQQAYAAAQETQNRWFMAYALNELGHVARALQEYDQARQHYRASYAIRQSFNDPEGMAVALNHLGRVARLQGAHTEAQQLYERSLKIYRDIGDRGGLATALNGLGNAATAQGQTQAARQYFREALQIAADIHFVPLILAVLAGAGELMVRAGDRQHGSRLLALVREHPAGEQETRERARRALARHRDELPPELPEATVPGPEGELKAAIESTLAKLHLTTTAVAGKPDVSAPREQPLVDPLTEREMEVLELIADGLTNKEIAGELVISVGTVKWYTSQIYGKLGVDNRTRAAARARELGLLP